MLRMRNRLRRHISSEMYCIAHTTRSSGNAGTHLACESQHGHGTVCVVWMLQRVLDAYQKDPAAAHQLATFGGQTAEGVVQSRT